MVRADGAARGTAEVRLRLHRPASDTSVGKDWFGHSFDDVMAAREADADEFYAALAPAGDGHRGDASLAAVVRRLGLEQADLPLPGEALARRRSCTTAPAGGSPPRPQLGWRHLDSFDVLAMPDPWEYPWFAAWDLAFHTISWAHLDPAFAKYQLLVLKEWFQHLNGALRRGGASTTSTRQSTRWPPSGCSSSTAAGTSTGARLPEAVAELTWWLNRQDPDGNNLLRRRFPRPRQHLSDDRSHLPDGVRLDQADGTAGGLLLDRQRELAVALADRDSVYDDMVVKFSSSQ